VRAVRPWQRLDRGCSCRHTSAKPRVDVTDRFHEAFLAVCLHRCQSSYLIAQSYTTSNTDTTMSPSLPCKLRPRCHCSQHQLTRDRCRRRRVAPKARRTPGPARTVRERRRIRQSADKVQLCLGTEYTSTVIITQLTPPGPDQIQRTPRPARRRAPAIGNLPRKP
jgi:hypothetical protein